MLVFDFHRIGSKMFAARKRLGLTQTDVAEAAGISDRTYADIERGTVNMRVETILKICSALKVDPDDLLTEQTPQADVQLDELWSRLAQTAPQEKETAARLLSVYLDSLG